MSEFVTQIGVLTLSLLGVVALLPGPDRRGDLRLPGVFGAVVTYVGITCFVGPWFVAPLLNQPRIIGASKTLAQVIGAMLMIMALALYAFSLKVLLPAFRGRFSEFTPHRLITVGPYSYVRHPIYLSVLTLVLSVDLIQCATLSLLFLPICYLSFWLVAVYEERCILTRGFSHDFTEYRARVKPRILGLWPGILIALLYIAFAVPSLLSLLRWASFDWMI